jgi:ferredoxin
MAIDPDGCIDCGVCVSECPVDAIVYDDDLPENQRHFIKINLDLASKWPEITKSRPPLPEAEKWKDVKDKLQFLESA